MPAVASKDRSPRLVRRLEEIKTKLAEAKDLALRTVADENEQIKDRLVVMVRDPYWLHAYWELSRRSIERAARPWGSTGTKPGRSCGFTRLAATARPARPVSPCATSRFTAA